MDKHRLRKLLFFRMAVETGRGDCYRCDLPILNPDELSIDHKEDWRAASDKEAVFFDLNNIAFSHLSCNSKAGRKWNRGKTHCLRGHQLTENRVCGTCRRGHASALTLSGYWHSDEYKASRKMRKVH